MRRKLKAIISVCLFLGVMTFSHFLMASPESIADRPEPLDQPTKVRVILYVIDIDNISTAEQNFTANFYYLVQWNDPRLAHKSDKDIFVPLSSIWNPGLQIVNQQRIFQTLPEVAEIKPNGNVFYRQRVWGNLSQPLKLRRFPFDKQQFTIQMVAPTYSPDEVEIILDKRSGISQQFSQPDWDITGWNMAITPYQPLKDIRVTSGFTFTMEGERYIGYYMFNFLIPLMFIVCMSFIALWVYPTETSTRMSIAVTSMLTLIAYRFIIGTSLPKVSYLTRLDIFILASTTLVFIVLIITAITSIFVKRNRLLVAKRIDDVCYWLFPIALIFIMLLPLLIYD